MQGRVIRRLVVVLLILGGGGAAFLAYRLQQTYDNLLASQFAVVSSLDQLAATVQEIGPAQQAYVVPGQPLRASIDRVEMLTRQVSDTATAIRPRLRSPLASSHLQGLSNTLDSLQQIDGRIRENLLIDDATAGDVIFGDAREAIASMTTTVRALQQDEIRTGASDRAMLTQQGWTIAGTIALAWTLGLLLLARAPRRTEPVISEPVAGAPLVDESPDDLMLHSAVPAAGRTPAEGPTIDLAAAAEICTAVSRVTSSNALPDLLARAAVVLDATGIIVWMSAGDELFAVTGYGYDARLLARLGPIGRDANNATAAAWRTGEAGTVAGDMMSNGAIVAPMFGADGCVGVLAAEIRHGRESDAATKAVTSLFAAQFAAVIAAWPVPVSDHTAGDIGGESTDALPASV